ncbi:unnamed protein product [Notodromas monacha]|uniref:Ras modification protein ERF4 n=1 Tax=Notodromas monacha TaxID=399045 RepID=A0A7R9BXP8_9CRUS|nr:unnamed protein product [Notodromas monacha]CAG0922735.1 unnamed protein product [Notodromas monacha]
MTSSSGGGMGDGGQDTWQLRLTAVTLTTGEKVFIQRDYTEGTGVKFETRFPQELEGKIDRQVFEDAINEINSVFAEAEHLSCSSCLSGCLACLTGYFTLCCMETHYEKCLKKVSRLIYRRNERDFIPKGLMLGEPVERALRVIEITILNTSTVT